MSEYGENADLRLFCSGVFVAEKVEGLFVLVDLGESARWLVEAVVSAVVVDLRDLAEQNLFAAAQLVTCDDLFEQTDDLAF